jgi:gluconokinase
MTAAVSSRRRPAPQIVVVMGLSGVGKSTVANGIADALGWLLAEGDDFHPEGNRQKMAAGHPLTDEDRWPWLESIGAWMDERLAASQSAVVTCSALKRSYRDLLRAGRPGVRFCELDAPADLIADRLDHRTGHYMPPSLLQSQLATLEPLANDEPGVHVSSAATPEQTVRDSLAALHLDDTEPSA